MVPRVFHNFIFSPKDFFAFFGPKRIFWKTIGTKNSDGKFFKDQKMRKKSLETKNEILENYKNHLFI
jgi:hypothetical protein